MLISLLVLELLICSDKMKSHFSIDSSFLGFIKQKLGLTQEVFKLNAIAKIKELLLIEGFYYAQILVMKPTFGHLISLM